MTEIDTGEGKLYLATVLDLSRGGCSATPWASTTTPALTEAALEMAVATRGGEVATA